MFISSAQFWNIPITFVKREGNVFVKIYESDDSRHRLIPADLVHQTWDHTPAPCYYVGDSQGGPSHSRDPTESVIQGRLSHYETSSLFATSFYYSQFEDSFCDSGSV